MTTQKKLLIGAAVLGGGFLAWKYLISPMINKPEPEPTPAPGGSVNQATTNAVANVQQIPVNVRPKPGALIAATGGKNLVNQIKQNVAASTNVQPTMGIVAAATKPQPTRTIIPPKPVVRPGANKLGTTFY
jgi:hypothetical protein